MKTNKFAELPIVEPIYKTYQYQGSGAAVIENNSTIRNWYLNETINLTCRRFFLQGFGCPFIDIVGSSLFDNPYLEKNSFSTRFLRGSIHRIIRNMIDAGYYVYFTGVDDYYIKNKSFYKQRHLNHDGLICGYNQNDKTYCIYAHDSNWICRKFWTPQKCFNTGWIAGTKNGVFGNITALKVKGDSVDFSPKIAYVKLKEYLDSNFEKYPFDGAGDVYGIVVHEYIAEYISKLHRGEVLYERMDWRVFRLIWEHKKVMLERIVLIEQSLDMDNEISKKYKTLVAEADTMRMLYASHHMKRRDSVLPIIKKKLLTLMKNEQELLTSLVEKMGKELENEAVEVS